jgi:alkylated DNA repair protein (DNA oxidative demethylase)
MQPSLFPSAGLPSGFVLHEGLITAAEEADLLAWMRTLPTEPYVMRGQASLRRIRPFGPVYGRETLGEPLPFPEELVDVRARAAHVAGLDPSAFVQAICTYYPAGAGIGWHRDFPQFGPVILGISLLSTCRMRLRPRDDPRRTVDVELPPRSLYVLGGAARLDWEHHLPAVEADRWSITLRTKRARP